MSDAKRMTVMGVSRWSAGYRSSARAADRLAAGPGSSTPLDAAVPRTSRTWSGSAATGSLQGLVGPGAAGTTTPAPASGASAAASTAVGRSNRANRRSVRARRAPGRELMGRTGAPSARTGWVRRHRGPQGEPRARSWSRSRLPVQVLIGVSTGLRCGGHQLPVLSTARPDDQPIPGGTAQPRRPPQCPRDGRASAGRQRVSGSSGCLGAGDPHICRPPPGCRAPLAAQRAGAWRCGAHWTLAARRDRGSSAQQLSAAGRFAALLSVDAVPFDGRAPVHLLPHPLDLADGPVFLA